MSVRILHAADMHLDSPFEALSGKKAVAMRQAQRDVLSRIADAAVERDAQLVLIAGDLFDSDASYADTHDAMCEVFSKISARVFISPGNHDYYNRSSAYAFLKLPENVHVFSTRTISAVVLPELSVRVWGGAFTSEHEGAPLAGFSVPDSDMCEIMVLHGDVSGSEGYNPISEADIAASGLDYLALGHIHSFSGILKSGNTAYAYPGCTLGRGFDETGEKGLIAGAVHKGGAELEFVPLGGRQYRIVTHDISCGVDPADKLMQYRNDIVRLILTGEYESVSPARLIESKLSESVFSLEIVDRTLPKKSVWDGMDDDTLRGLFLRKMRPRYDGASDDEREKLITAVRYGLAALDGREDIFS